ncbi:glycosyltransferase [Flaviramulus sp. BrNp1-15]|uniref:glycosyltransferase family 2 protein n=1 Tax=Flaviramulus sp. BrNp1-15 TaxID=2916754 RepID=UPI001EE7CD58|nr:glycosyltransferase [Flaviramulus sp. BrNp1-15]ULC58996.1 glycosyltransferase [Flaviramulus sp. BrNp1-15]
MNKLGNLNRVSFFSIVIPLYNKEKYVEATIKSVLNQTFKDFELLIINDGSTDNSLKLIKKFKDDRINIFSQKNSGLSATRNIGIKKARANYIAFIDADDLWFEDYLETMHNLIQLNKNYSVFASNYKLLKPKKSISLSNNKPFKTFKKKIISNYFDLTNYKITQSSIVINKNVFEKVGCFDETINYAEDEDFYIRCFANYDLIFYKDPKIYYRVGFETQMSSPNPNFKRVIPDFSSYLNENNLLILKPYLDTIHYKLVVLFKMEKNQRLVRFYKKKIDIKNLNFIQKIKYYLPVNAFYYSKLFYIRFSKIFSNF